MARFSLITYLVIGLTLVGLMVIASASVVSAARDFGDKWYYLKLQSVWAGVGLILFFIGTRLPYRKLTKTGPIWLGLSLITLLAVLIPGIGSKIMGARRWINLGFISFQPTELAKFSLCVYFASLFKKARPTFTAFIVVTVGVAGLVMLQPDLGTALVIIGLSLIIYFGSGGELKRFFIFAPIAIIVVSFLIFFSSYRRDRLSTFLNPHSDPLGTSYHIRQVLISLGSGGFWGVGFGESRQKYGFLPEVTTDSIFAVIAEEWGFVGAFVLICAYLMLIMQGFEVSKNASSLFGSVLSLGITSWIGVQTVINLAAMVALFPLTGIPLPYISYGGTSLVLLLFASGILVNIAADT